MCRPIVACFKFCGVRSYTLLAGGHFKIAPFLLYGVRLIEHDNELKKEKNERKKTYMNIQAYHNLFFYIKASMAKIIIKIFTNSLNGLVNIQ